MKILPLTHYSKKYKFVFYLLLSLCVARLLLSFNSVCFFKNEQKQTEARLNEEERKIHSVLRVFLSIVAFIIPISGILGIIAQDLFVTVLLGFMWALFLGFDLFVGYTFREELVKFTHGVDLLVVLFLVYFAKLLRPLES